MFLRIKNAIVGQYIRILRSLYSFFTFAKNQQQQKNVKGYLMYDLEKHLTTDINNETNVLTKFMTFYT